MTLFVVIILVMTVNLENYRSSLEYREILRILQKASSLQENFVWQSTSMGKNIISIHHLEIDFVAREVVVYFDGKTYMIESDLPVYVKLDYRTSVFKVPEFRMGLGCLYFPFPKEIKTQELRNNTRFPFTPDNEKHVSIKPSLAGKRETGGELQVRLMDISYYGLGLIISEYNRSFIKNNRILWITKLQDEILPDPILAEVVYISNELDHQYQTRKNKELRVGLKLSGIFPLDIFQRFLQ
ncbi:MAG TPA: hypothetical protein VNJ08_14295 [Bacteriovoracaceae bacterium]|nr:hypothetical protein [Bacteriovoracaceae bacterium]